jgi:hypothetical protein
MRQHAFRPQVLEILEPRAVPSMAGVSASTGILGISVTLPKQVPIASPQVQAAFAAFDQSYIQAVDNILLAPGPNGLVVPSNNRTAFDAALQQSLETLAEQLVLSLGTTSTGSTQANQVVDAIVGTSSNSLENQLLALPTSTIGFIAPLPITPASSIQAVIPTDVNTAEVVRPPLRVPEGEAASPLAVSTDPTSTSASSSAASNAANDVRSAFGNFLNDYFKAVQGVLLAPDAAGQINSKAHRADFDAKVNLALQSLEARLTTTLSHYPATSALAPQVQAAIGGNGASSLKAELGKLATPESAQAATVRDFTLGSSKAIAQALSLITGDVSKALSPAGK